MDLFLSLIPFVLLIFLILIKGYNLLISSGVVTGVTLLIVLFNWQPAPSDIFWTFIKSFCLSLDVMMIVFGALLFQGFLKNHGIFDNIIYELRKLTNSTWLLVLLLSWNLGSFIEGISGFGAPAALIAPVLVGIGLSPFQAIIISLIGNSVPVTFGALGTPIKIGLAGFLGPQLINNVASINLYVGWIVPLLIIFFISKSKDENHHSKTKYLWALISAFCFLIPYYFISFYGVEFPSALGGAIGFILMVLFIRFLNPDPNLSNGNSSLLKLLIAFYPYLLVIVFLILGRTLFYNINFTTNLGNHFNHTFNLFQPGIILFTVVLIINFLKLKTQTTLRQLIAETIKKLLNAGLTLWFVSLMSCLIILTEIDQQKGILTLIGERLAGPYYIYFSALIGSLGAFLTGSATVSNILLANLQTEIAQFSKINLDTILTLQLSGAAAGNMISLINILAVSTTVGYEMNLKKILRSILPYCAAVLILYTVIGRIYLT